MDFSEKITPEFERREILNRLANGETFDALKLRFHFEGTHVKNFLNLPSSALSRCR